MASKFLKVFAKSQLTASAASLFDYGVYFALTAIFGKEVYVIARAVGSAVGAIINFFLNRHWTWKSGEKALGLQALKYGLTSLISLILNTFGTWLLTEHFTIDYRLSALIVGLIMAIGFNFVMHHFFVFKK